MLEPIAFLCSVSLEREHISTSFQSSSRIEPAKQVLAARTLSPSEEQSAMGQPWSLVENGQAPLLMWRYHFSSGPGQSSLTCKHLTLVT